MYKALIEHWNYDPSKSVYLDAPSELLEPLPLHDSTTHTDPGLGPSLPPLDEIRAAAAANPLKGK